MGITLGLCRPPKIKTMKSNRNDIEGRSSAPCSPSSLTPETDAMVAADQHHLEDDNFFPATVYWRMCDLARTLERERDEWRGKAVDLHARHKGALEDIEAEISERNEARAIAAEACAMLADNGFETNYPPMPWDSDSPENTPDQPPR